MSNRIDLPLTRCPAAGVIAALPWLTVLFSTSVLAAATQPWLYLLAPFALMGAGRQFAQAGLLRGAGAIQGLEVHDELLWARMADGRRCQVRPAADCRIGGSVALLKLSFPATRYWPKSLVLLGRDSPLRNVPTEPFRQLRVWLRLRGRG